MMVTDADIVEILRYLTLNPASTEPRKDEVGLPTRQLRLTTNIFKLSMGTVRILWKPMLSANYNVRVAALRLFELYTSEKVVLHKSDMLMLYSSFKAHTLTGDIADLLLDIVIGRKSLPQGNSRTSAEVRTGSFARMMFIPLVLLSLIHNANFDIQAVILTEIRIQLASPTMGDSVKEAIRSWPSWLSRLRALTRGASVAAADVSSDIETTRENSSKESAELNEACSILSSDFVSAFAKLDALHVIAEPKDVSGCDFALSLLQNRSQGEAVTITIIAMVIKYFPQRWCDLVGKLANQIIVDIIVYCILHVKNGWMHFLEFYFCHCRAPPDFCSLAAVICEQLVRQATQKALVDHFEIIQENLCQVAAIVSQSSLVATKTAETLTVNDVVLSQDQQSGLTRNAFELWQLVLPHLNQINWDALVDTLIQSVDYGSGDPYEETAIFTHLVAPRSRTLFWALQTTIHHTVLAQTSNTNNVELSRKFCNVLERLQLIGSVQVTTTSQRSSESMSPLSGSSSSGTLSLPASGPVLSDMELSLAGMTDALMFFAAIPGSDIEPDRDLIHMYSLDSCFIILEVSLEKRDIETVRLLVKVMVALASTALNLRDPNAKPASTKTLQIMSSTDLTFFNELSQFRELFMLWKLHRENHGTCCDSLIFEVFADHLNAEFIQNWIYIMEHHTMEFNPYLIQQHATSQAELLGEELQQCENMWKDITDENEVAEVAGASGQGMTDKSRLVELKLSAENFASNVHKLLARSSRKSVSPSLFSNDGVTSVPVAEEFDTLHDVNSGNGIVCKVDFRENNFRMRIRLKKVPKDYRTRNLSREYPASSLADAESKESGRRLDRRYRGSTKGGLVDLESSRRSDAESDYNDFLADAQMRGAIIRSLSNSGEGGSAYSGVFDDDDLEGEDTGLYDAQEEDDRPQFSDESQLEDTEVKLAAHNHSAKVTPSSHVKAAASDQSSVLATSIDILGKAEKAVVTSASASSPSPMASPPFNGYSLGTSVLNMVGGVADYFQNSVNDAKDAAEYGVDTLYTTKDAVSEEAQALMNEVSLYTQGRNVLPAESLRPAISSLDVTSSLLKRMEFKPVSDELEDRASKLLLSSPTTRDGQQGYGNTVKRANARPEMDLQVKAQLVRHLQIIEGKLFMSSSSVRFVAERVIDEHESVIVEKKAGVPVNQAWRFLFKQRRWKIDDIVNLYRRRYLLKPTALELFIIHSKKLLF
ncbi:unnamed protein product [Peronospora destructor]|uniref:BEACH-type PH domain-containing protein n=1 Tax=Peronospora destructor TaxID=86335 RepID=A0AAV0UCW3_9STRA|nr:unnamed protein product [Peronospora destructor]